MEQQTRQRAQEVKRLQTGEVFLCSGWGQGCAAGVSERRGGSWGDEPAGGHRAELTRVWEPRDLNSNPKHSREAIAAWRARGDWT